jgi:outer membrane immunogenic protein
MKNMLCGSMVLAVFAIAGSAQAADLPTAPFAKASPMSAPSWTGFYAGLGLGFRTTQTDLTTTSLLLAGVPADLSQSVVTQPFDGTGFRANPYVGFNWQVGPQWVIGLEGDVGFGDQTTRLAGFRSSPVFGSSTFAIDGLAVKSTWDASARGRIGYLLTPATLVYATGGAAWQHYEVTSTCASSTCTGNGVAPSLVANSNTRMGWTIGGGIETALGGNWLARAEYRYADFGTTPFTIARTATSGPARTADNFDATLRTHVASFGVAYKFGVPAAAGDAGLVPYPVKAQPATVSWPGPYVGFGLGARAARTDVTSTSESAAGFAFNMDGRANSRPFDGIAFRASPYVGYLWSVAPRWLAGVEGDLGFADHRTTRDGFTNITLADFQSPGESIAVRTTWDASLRGRLGYLVTPATLIYATGGVAWQHYQLESRCGSAVCAFLGIAPAVITNSTTKAGGTLGGGIETAIGGHWLARAEYRYADYGHSSFTVARTATRVGFNPNINTFDVPLRTHTASFGLTYRFE